MIIFLYGTDGYRLKENVDIIVDAYRKKHKSGMSYYRFDLGDEDKVDNVADAIKSVSFFDEAKLIVVKNAFARNGLTPPWRGQTIINLVRDLKVGEDKKTILVFVENGSEGDLRKADKDLFALLAGKNNLVRSFEYLSGVKLSNWVKNKFKENGHNVSLAVVSLLIGIVGGESWALANEVNKLSNYLTGKTCHDRSCLLTKEDVDLLVSRKEINSIFELTDAVGSQNKAKAFEMMYRLTNSGQDPHYILTMLVYHFENLLSVSDLLSRRSFSGNEDLASKCGLHPFVAKKAAGQARRFSKKDLLSKFNYLAELDIVSKNGTVNLEDALYVFTVSPGSKRIIIF